MEEATTGACGLHHAHRCQISHQRLRFSKAIRQREVCDLTRHSREGLRAMRDLQPKEMKLPEFSVEVVSMISGAGAAYISGDPSTGYAITDFINDRLHGLVNLFARQKQSKRITTVTRFSLEGIARRLKSGEQLRDDGFFDETVDDRSKAEEVFEAVLLVARDTPQEKKMPYISKLFEEACFRSYLRSDTLHFLCKEHENLTYRQLCIIKIIYEGSNYIFETLSFQESEDTDIAVEKIAILTECANLRHRGYIDFETSQPEANQPSDPVPLLIPYTMRVLSPAEMVYTFMDLKSIPEDDISPILAALKK